MEMNTQFRPRRLPCKARSVPADHTAENAYFDIPQHAEHGMPLVCSYPECSLSGARFKYCAVCEIPVAKRNFARRHSHGLLSLRGFASGENGSGFIPSAKRYRRDSDEQNCSYSEHFSSEIVSPLNLLMSPNNNVGMMLNSLNASSHQEAPICTPIGQDDTFLNPIHQVSSSLMLQEQDKEEEQEEQPRTNHLSPKRERCDVDQIGLQELNASRIREQDNPANPTPCVSGSDLETKGAGVTVMHLTSWERDWNSLLYSRPPTSDRKKMHEWMEKVLSKSEAFADDDDVSTQENGSPSIHDTVHNSSIFSTEDRLLQTFSSNITPHPLLDDEQRTEISKAA
mmetsp:Transcript_2216/g.3192  ORF Transcript_2216/g.3192 Transcript_2216/m.3192 type:complete len:340 (-) Transcript_2216:122-1141(-)